MWIFFKNGKFITATNKFKTTRYNYNIAFDNFFVKVLWNVHITAGSTSFGFYTGNYFPGFLGKLLYLINSRWEFKLDINLQFAKCSQRTH